MWIKLDPKDLWGRPVQYDDYCRFKINLTGGFDKGVANQKLGTPQASSRRIRYNNGLFFIFKTTSKTIQIKYKFHHSDNDDYASSRQAVVEPQLCGKLTNNNWVMLNTGHMLDKTYPKVAETEWILTYKLRSNETFTEFQFCLPFGVNTYYLEINTEGDFQIVKPKDVKFGFLGSSVTNMSACYAASSLTAQIYRDLGLNSCNLAIPLTHSLAYKEMLDFIKKNKQIKWYCCDTINIDEDNIKSAKDLGVKFTSVNCRWRYTFKDVNYIFDLDNPCYNRDNLHLTTAGAVAFVQALLPLLKKEI